MKLLFLTSLIALAAEVAGLVESWIDVDESLLTYLDNLVLTCTGAKNHGQFVKCVGQSCSDALTEAAELTKKDCNALKKGAAKSDIGKVSGLLDVEIPPELQASLDECSINNLEKFSSFKRCAIGAINDAKKAKLITGREGAVIKQSLNKNQKDLTDALNGK